MSPDLPWIDDGHRPVDGSTPVKLEVDSVEARQILDSSGDFGGFVPFFFLVVQLCPFFGGSVLIGGSVALAVAGLTSCVRWLNGADPMVEWCGIEVLLWCGGCFFFVVVQWERSESEREMKTKIKEND
jgi:hypothetical protein